MKQAIRTINAFLLFPLLKVTGFSFSKQYRWESNLYYSVVYNCVDTVRANWLAHGKKMRTDMQDDFSSK